MYTAFARVYDALMDTVDYPGWAAHYRRLMAACGVPGNGKCVECACGTGSLTILLARYGYQMTGVDISQEMLFHASNKARASGLGIPFVRQDMRRLRLHRPMDAVLATCDGLNYLLEEADVSAFFQAAWNALRPGGGLFFDVSTPAKLRTALGSQLIGYDSENITYLWQNTYHERSATVDLRLAVFLRQKDGSYRRIDEAQRQKAHSMQALTGLLQQTGFRNIHVYGDCRPEPPRENEQRWHFAALKPAELPVDQEAGR